MSDVIHQLYGEERADFTEENNLEGSKFKAKVTDAIWHIRKGQAVETEEIIEEELQIMGEFGIELWTKVLYVIHNSGYLSNDMLKAACIITLLKRQGAIEC